MRTLATAVYIVYKYVFRRMIFLCVECTRGLETGLPSFRTTRLQCFFLVPFDIFALLSVLVLHFNRSLSLQHSRPIVRTVHTHATRCRFARNTEGDNGTTSLLRITSK